MPSLKQEQLCRQELEEALGAKVASSLLQPPAAAISLPEGMSEISQPEEVRTIPALLRCGHWLQTLALRQLTCEPLAYCLFTPRLALWLGVPQV